MYRVLILVATSLTLIVIVVGAYVRLSDAGLGCPDWPGCYGQPTPSFAASSIARAVADQGGEQGPVSLVKAWKEMGHRYLAGALGLLIAWIAVLSWRQGSGSGSTRGLTATLVAVVAFQAALGMWTVTLLLKPVIVTAHLLGGLATLGLLLWLSLTQWRFVRTAEGPSMRPVAIAGLVVVVLQIALGGWVSANYAALACPDFPLCQGKAVPDMDIANAFHVFRELGKTREGALLSLEALTAIHWMHRMFALVVAAVLAWLVWQGSRTISFRGLSAWVGVMLVLQISLGISTVLAGLPLALAAAHNLGGALLFGSLVLLNFFAFSGLAPRRAPS